ncbi:MAG: metallophosphoesterase family protein [Anaerolineae bacterium]
MKILIFSDLHGNWEALQALQAAESRPDALLFLGDVVGFGPDPKACLAWVRRNATYAVRGNHDHAVARRVDCRCSPEYHDLSVASREHTWRALNEADLQYLGSLPLEETVTLGGATFYLTHAAPSDPLYKSVDLIATPQKELKQEIKGLAADIILLGHTHVPAIRRVDTTYLVNPGSLGQPRHGTPSATYAVWQDGELAIRHVDYDRAATQRKLSLLPLDPEHILRLQEILERGM